MQQDYFVLFEHQAIKKNGITRFMNPIDANHNQSFENASIFILFAKHKSTTGIAPRKILKNAIVTGPKEYVAILILKNADAQIKDKVPSSK